MRTGQFALLFHARGMDAGRTVASARRGTVFELTKESRMRAHLFTFCFAATLFSAYGIAQPDFTPSQKVLINGPIAQGGTALFQVLIGNSGTVPTSGTITVTDTGGAGLN